MLTQELESRPDIRKRYGIIPEMEPPPSTEFPLKPTGVKINTKGPFVCRYSLKMLKKLYAKKTKCVTCSFLCSEPVISYVNVSCVYVHVLNMSCDVHVIHMCRAY